jgi:hypothetical protein
MPTCSSSPGAKRATQERIENGHDHGRPPFGLTYGKDGRYWVPDRDTDEYRAVFMCIRLREDGHVAGDRARNQREQGHRPPGLHPPRAVSSRECERKRAQPDVIVTGISWG